MRKITWGIISTAKIGTGKVIPAMQKSKRCAIRAIASRNVKNAAAVAEKLAIPKVYGSYEELLADPQIEAVYNPLPNHLHVPWTISALKSGKHVLCEKPIALNTEEARELAGFARTKPQLKLMEAFMYRHHPQWIKAKQLADDQAIGTLKSIQSFFSYFNNDPENIRNKADIGGGGLMDIGCYCISLSRFMFDREPKRVIGLLNYDQEMKIDYLSSGMLDFENGHSTFTCSTQLTAYQRVNIMGTKGRIEIEIPFNAPPDKPTRLWLYQGENVQEYKFDSVDQYTIQADLFSEAIITDGPVPTPIEDAVKNMAAIDALIESGRSGRWSTLL